MLYSERETYNKKNSRPHVNFLICSSGSMLTTHPATAMRLDTLREFN